MGQDRFVAEDAVKGGATDLELPGGAELVAAIEFDNIVDMIANDGVEREVIGNGWWRDELSGDFLGIWEGQVFGADDAVYGLEQGGFENRGKFADIARPGVLEQAGKRAGSEGDGALLIARADSVEKALGQGSDIFAALAQGGNGEANGTEAEGEVG